LEDNESISTVAYHEYCYGFEEILERIEITELDRSGVIKNSLAMVGGFQNKLQNVIFNLQRSFDREVNNIEPVKDL
jgi:hypothetical protein